VLELVINGRAFHVSLPGGESACALRLSGRNLVARMPNGDVLKLDLSRAEFQRGGPNGDEFVFASTTPEGPTFITEDADLHQATMLAWPTAHQALAARSARPSGKTHLSRFQIVALVVAIAIVGSVLGAIVLVGPGSRVALRFIPRSVDDRIGREAFAHVLRSIGGPDSKPREEQAIRDPVETVLDRLNNAVPNNPFHFRVAVCDSPMLNAFALPGGQIVITTRMLATLESADELAAVMAHEMNHVLLRHSMEMTIRASGLRFLVHVGTGGHWAVGIAASVWSAVGVMGYSRDKEREADRGAVHLLIKAGIDANALLPMFAKLLAEEERFNMKNVEPSTQKLMEKFRTHPAIGQRIVDVEREIANSPAVSPRPLEVNYATLKAATEATRDTSAVSPMIPAP
jgi:Zn-dependent protease with chaperone function